MNPLRVLTAVLLSAAPVLWSASPQPVRARHGMVSSAQAEATDAGVEILKQGGNAVDAAVATAFALAVTYPSAGNIGGGGFMVIRRNDGRAAAIDYRETASGRASKTRFLDAAGNVIPDAPKTGHRAAGVPGTVAGMALALEKFGTKPWKDVLAPAIRLAEEGFPVSHSLARQFQSSERRFSQYAETKRIFLRNGRFYNEGDRLTQPELAATLRRIAANGPREFYDGKTARLLEAEMKANGGLVALDDLKQYKAILREPVRGRYRGYELISMPPVSSGGFLLMQMLGMLERFDLRSMGPHSSAADHLLIEVMKRAYADRAAWFGDPAFVTVPLARLLSPAYVATRAASIRQDRATPSEQIREGSLPRESNDTTHFSVVDAQGNAVSNTYTLRDSYGSGIVVTGAGFFLNNVMDEFAAKAGAPNAFGYPAGEANTIAPGKRPVSSQTPTIAVKDGKLAFVIGTPGGTTIPNTVLQVTLNLIDHGMNIQEAIDAPRIHHQWLPDIVRCERHALAKDVLHALEAKGHKFAPEPAVIGQVHGIAVDANGVRLGGADSRGSGKAAGY
ncbi:MAG: gamma-glutamyltransferase [Bryobacterales bacterium]|nr:gamma-glutamyltransferase [Bryobacterales bacterium]